MQLNYAYRFVAYEGSNIPSSPWQQMILTLERDSKIVQEIQQKGFYSKYEEISEGYFAHRYELVKIA